MTSTPEINDLVAGGNLFEVDGEMDEGPSFERRVKKKRKLTTACDFCRKRKIKCNGVIPCAACKNRNSICTFTPQKRRGPQPKKQKSAPQPTNSRALIATFTRTFYFDKFFEYTNAFYDMVERDDVQAPYNTLTKSVLFQHHVALAFSARALGHGDVTNELVAKAREYASELFDDMDEHSALGYSLLSLFYLGEDKNRSMHLASVARSISEQCVLSGRGKRLKKLLQFYSRMDERKHTMTTEETQESRMGAVKRALNPSRGPVMGILKRMPTNSELADLACELCLTDRLPVEEQSDELLSVDEVAPYMESLQNAERVLAEYKETADEGGNGQPCYKTVADIYNIRIYTDYFVFACGCGDLKTAALAIYPVLKYAATHHNVIGFAPHMAIPRLVTCAAFVDFYGPALLPEVDANSVMMEIAELLRPLAPHFLQAKRSFEAINRILKRGLGSGRVHDNLTSEAVLPAPLHGFLHPPHESVVDDILKKNPGFRMPTPPSDAESPTSARNSASAPPKKNKRSKKKASVVNDDTPESSDAESGGERALPTAPVPALPTATSSAGQASVNPIARGIGTDSRQMGGFSHPSYMVSPDVSMQYRQMRQPVYQQPGGYYYANAMYGTPYPPPGMYVQSVSETAAQGAGGMDTRTPTPYADQYAAAMRTQQIQAAMMGQQSYAVHLQQQHAGGQPMAQGQLLMPQQYMQDGQGGVSHVPARPGVSGAPPQHMPQQQQQQQQHQPPPPQQQQQQQQPLPQQPPQQ